MELAELTPQAAMERLFEVKAELEELAEEKRVLSEFLADVDEDELFLEHDGKRYRARVSIGTRTKVNLRRLRALAPGLYGMVTKPVIDLEALRSTIDEGLWTTELRDECVTYTQNSPAVRFDELTTAITAEGSDA